MAATQQQRRIPPFRLSTRLNYSPIAPQTISNWGSFVTFRLPQNGYGSRLLLYCNGSVTTTGTVSIAPVAYPPNPFSFINQIKVYTSDAPEFINVGGWTLFALHNRQRSRFQNLAVDLDTYQNTNNRAALYTALGTISSATTTNFSFVLEVPLGTDELMQRGLVPLQNQAVQYSMDVRMANLTDVLTVSTGTVSAVSLTVSPLLEWFSVPRDPGSQPSQRWVHSLREVFTQLQTGTGQTVYRLLSGPVYARVNMLLENNGAVVPPANISNVFLQYASAVTIRNQSYYQHAMEQKLRMGSCPLDGYIGYDFSAGSGVPGIWDLRDLFNSANQSEIQIVPTLSGVTLAGTSQIRALEERLTIRQ